MTQQTMGRPLRVGLISRGCAKNLVDAEIMLGTLLKDGVQITNDAAQADVVIVNSCSLIVSGCLPPRFREELPRLFPEVDAFMGIDQVAQVTDIVRQALARGAERIGKKHPTSNIRHPT